MLAFAMTAGIEERSISEPYLKLGAARHLASQRYSMVFGDALNLPARAVPILGENRSWS
jgi:hypothetical protein